MAKRKKNVSNANLKSITVTVKHSGWLQMVVWKRRKHLVSAVYCDFSYAFDVMDNQLLLKKLSSYGFNDSIINFIIIQVKGNSTLSCDIPHVSCLGHFLYSIIENEDSFLFKDAQRITSANAIFYTTSVIHQTACFNKNGVWFLMRALKIS